MMSVTETTFSRESSPEIKKRKREANEEDLEIDVNAPEPPSKKALRKAKKTKASPSSGSREQNIKVESELAGTEENVVEGVKRSPYGIWIGNLSFATTKDDLLSFVTGDAAYSIPAERVTRVNLPSGPLKFGKFQNKGFAYVDFADEKALKSALQLSEKLLGGRRVLIKDATNFEGRPKDSTKAASGHPPSKRVFIGNLDFETTAEDLENHFGVCGPIQQTHMATFEDSGKCKGYAWVEFENLSSGQAAMRGWVEEDIKSKAEGKPDSKRRIWLGKINGRKLRMEFAEDKTTRYNKRYGKNANKEDSKNNDAITEVSSAQGMEPAEQNEKRNGESTTRNSSQVQRDDGKPRKQRYTEDTVKKLTGAIVEGQGQKVTFD